MVGVDGSSRPVAVAGVVGSAGARRAGDPVSRESSIGDVVVGETPVE